MAHLNVKFAWKGKTPKGAPDGAEMVWPSIPQTEEEADDFRTTVHEYMDNEYGQQPRGISKGGPFGAMPARQAVGKPIIRTQADLHAKD